jgi:hypothetical protein
MERTQQASNRLADRTRTEILSLWALVVAGEITRPAFRTRASAAVARANTAGVQLADIGRAAEITRQLRRPTPPLGLRPNRLQVDQSRMARDIDRITTLKDPSDSLGQWARSEPLLTVATAIQVAMSARGVEGWTRRLSGASCPLCTRWADGQTRPTSVSMVRHPGCDCIQQPVLI